MQNFFEILLLGSELLKSGMSTIATSERSGDSERSGGGGDAMQKERGLVIPIKGFQLLYLVHVPMN